MARRGTMPERLLHHGAGCCCSEGGRTEARVVAPGHMLHVVDVPVVLTIAGSDSSGGAGIQADLKTFAAHRCYGSSAITAITAQNTVGVRAIHACPPDIVAAQIAAVIEDLPVRAAKTGMLMHSATVVAVVQALAGVSFPLVVDPVLISTSGHALLQDDAVEVLLHRLLPLAALVTPNLPEAARLSGCSVDDGGLNAAQVLLDKGAAAVLVKGGHADGDDVVDLLVTRSYSRRFVSKRLKTPHTHGTGCTVSAAITAGLARGQTLDDAVAAALAYVHTAIERAPGLGAGQGPLHHWHCFDDVG